MSQKGISSSHVWPQGGVLRLLYFINVFYLDELMRIIKYINEHLHQSGFYEWYKSVRESVVTAE